MFDVGAYIASGVIEVCLMGLGTPEEVAELEQLSREYPAVAAEVAAVRATLEHLHMGAAQDLATTPPPALKAKILAAALNEAPLAPEPAPAQAVMAGDSPDTGTQSKWFWPLVALAGLGVAGSLLLGGLWFAAKDGKQQAETDVARKQARIDSLQTVVLQIEDELRVAQEARDSIWMACADRVELKGLDLAPQARAFVYYDARSGEVRAEVAMLPVAPAGKGYQLWAIVKGQPVDLGMLSMQGETMPVAAMKAVMGAEAFAVTLEQAGGSPAPTLEQMYVLGTV